MDTYRILLNGVEVARISGEGLELGRRAKDATFPAVLEPDPKLIKKCVHGDSVFVLMASQRKSVTVEKVE